MSTVPAQVNGTSAQNTLGHESPIPEARILSDGVDTIIQGVYSEGMNKPIFVIKDFHPSIKGDMQTKVTREVPATAEGYDLFTSIRDVHPIVVEGDGMLTGWLVYLDDENYDENLADVDLAHGCGHGSSVRETTAVRTFDGTTVDAYIYRTVNFLDLQKVNGTSADVGIQVEHGNWMRWVTTKDFY